MAVGIESEYAAREAVYGEKAVQKQLAGFPLEFERVTKDACIPPKVKAKFIEITRKEITKITQRLATPGESEDPKRDRANLIRYLYTLNEVIVPMRTCDPLKDSSSIVQAMSVKYPRQIGVKGGLDGIITELIRAQTIKAATHVPPERRDEFEAALEEARDSAIEESEELFGDLPEGEKRVKTERLIAQEQFEASEEMTLQSVDDFSVALWQSIVGHLNGLAVDGAKGQKMKMIFSPCGLKYREYDEKEAKRLGMSKEEVELMAALDSMDKLAFIGTAGDWIEYYHDGNDAVVGERFHPISKRDWPGCWRDLYEHNRDYKNTLNEAELNKRIREAAVKATPKDFIRFPDMVEGKYSKMPQEGYD